MRKLNKTTWETAGKKHGMRALCTCLMSSERGQQPLFNMLLVFVLMPI
jgi:hypothetical protein